MWNFKCKYKRMSVGFLAFTIITLMSLALLVNAGEAPPPGSGKLLPRAYEGAPPLIPHDIEGMEGACLACHFEVTAGAPIAPHPDRASCQQCHVTQDLQVKPFGSGIRH